MPGKGSLLKSYFPPFTEKKGLSLLLSNDLVNTKHEVKLPKIMETSAIGYFSGIQSPYISRRRQFLFCHSPILGCCKYQAKQGFYSVFFNSQKGLLCQWWLGTIFNFYHVSKVDVSAFME